MTRYVAFLRAINVGGHTVKMDRLRELFVEMGFADAETFIASGNVIFTSKQSDDAKLEATIERALEKALGYEVVTFLRTDAEVAAIAAYTPFTSPEAETAQALNVAFLKAPFPAEKQPILDNFITDIDRFHTHGRELYWQCLVRQSQSTFNNNRLERQTALSATFRGINTLRRLAAKYPVR